MRHQQLLMRVTPTAAGIIEVHGIRVDYEHGRRDGVQHVGDGYRPRAVRR